MVKKKVAIGIDLGTSKCCVGVVRDGKVEILENERAHKTTPSYVAFTDTERLVGEDAKDQATLNPTNTVFGVKRIIGREMGDPVVKEAMEKMPYTVMNNGETRIHVSYKDTEEFLLPQQISAMMLGKMKDLTQTRLGYPVDEAVITVPASFTNAQRQATKDAATIAGLKVLALINEPTAAAIAYQVNRRNPSEENIAIVDFGAGNLNVAVVNVGKRRVCVKAVCGSAVIGGNDITEALMKHVVGKFKEKYGKKLPEGGAMTERLRSCCEKLKKILSLLPKVQDRLDCFGDDAILPVAIQREDFNSMIPSKVQISLKNCCIRMTQSSGLPMEEIKSVLLVGGSSRIPQFQVWLEEIFGKNSLDKSVNPDEAVACGAAYYAALLSKDNELEDIIVEDRVQNDFCFAIKGNSDLQRVFGQHSSATSRVFPFNEQSPFNERTRNETFELYEELTGQKNPHRLIGTLCLDDEFRQAVRLINDVTFAIDRCGIFNVVVQLKPNHVFSDVLKNCTGKLSEVMLNTAIGREKQFRKDDQDENERVEALSDLEALCFRLQSAMGDNKTKELFPELVKQICDKATENIDWLDATNNAAKAECVARVNTFNKLNNNLQLKIREYEKQETERVETVERLNDYLVEVETFLSSADLPEEERELAAQIERQVAQTKQWLQSTLTPSKGECNEKRMFLDQLHKDFSNRLEKRRQETERVIAMKNLRGYCSYLNDTLTKNSNGEDNRDLTDQLLNHVSISIQWLDSASSISTTDCETKKSFLKTLYAEIQQKVLTRKAEKRTASVRRLKSYCNILTSSVVNCKKYINIDPQLVAHLENEAGETTSWLGDGSTVSQAECDQKRAALENLEAMLKESVEKHTENEENRRVALQKFDTYVDQAKVSLPVLKKVTKRNEKLVRDIAEQTESIRQWLKTSDTFSSNEYDVKFRSLDELIETLRSKMTDDNNKVLSEKANDELNAFKDNRAYNLRAESNANNYPEAGNGPHSGSANGAGGRQMVGNNPRNDREAVASACEARLTRESSEKTGAKHKDDRAGSKTSLTETLIKIFEGKKYL